MPGLPASASSVTAGIYYVKRVAGGEPLETFLYELPEGKKANNAEGEEHMVKITDLRSVPQDFTLERNGFQLASLTVPSDLDWQDPDKVSTRPYGSPSIVCSWHVWHSVYQRDVAVYLCRSRKFTTRGLKNFC